MSAHNSKELGAKFKTCLKQAHHTNMGFIIAGQSVNTKVLPGFTNNDRNTLFAEIVFGAKTIREYIDLYGKKLGDKNLERISKILEEVDDWVIAQNDKVPDEAREYRLVLVADERSPKLFFLPNLDKYSFDYETIRNTQKHSRELKRNSSGQPIQSLGQLEAESQASKAILTIQDSCPDLPIGGSVHPGQKSIKYHCPCCNTESNRIKGKERFYCDNSECSQKTFSKSTAIKRA